MVASMVASITIAKRPKISQSTSFYCYLIESTTYPSPQKPQKMLSPRSTLSKIKVSKVRIISLDSSILVDFKLSKKSSRKPSSYHFNILFYSKIFQSSYPEGFYSTAPQAAERPT